jgi:hypothetical protein
MIAMTGRKVIQGVLVMIAMMGHQLAGRGIFGLCGGFPKIGSKVGGIGQGGNCGVHHELPGMVVDSRHGGEHVGLGVGIDGHDACISGTKALFGDSCKDRVLESLWQELFILFILENSFQLRVVRDSLQPGILRLC